MKIKLAAVVLAMAFMSSCEKESELNLESSPDNVRSLSATPQNYEDYLNQFYEEAFQITDSVLTSDEELTYKIYEVTLDGDSRGRGYVALNAASNDFLFFADVDRASKVLFTEDIVQGVEEEIDSLDTIDEYGLTNQYDYIAAVEDINDGLAPGSDIPDPDLKRKRKFIGKVLTPIGPCIGGQQSVHIQYYFFWLKNGDDQGVQPC